MSQLAYVRTEVLRTFRNRRFLFFSLGFPLVLFLTVAGANRSRSIEGIGFPLYYLAGMVSWGALIAVISSGSRIAVERQLGWVRQLRITPLRTRAYFASKVVSGYLMALLTIIILDLAATGLGVRLEARQWATMTLLLLVGLVPFAVLGILLGHLLRPDSLGPAVGGVTSILALLSGAWGPLSTGKSFVEAMKVLPSYWLVQSGRVAFGGSGWPPAEAWLVIGVWTLVLGRLAVLAYRRDTARVV